MSGPTALVTDVEAILAGRQANLRRAVTNNGRPATVVFQSTQDAMMRLLTRSVQNDAAFDKLRRVWARYRAWHKKHGANYFRAANAPRNYITRMPENVLHEHILPHLEAANVLRLTLSSKKARAAVASRIPALDPPASFRAFVTPLMRSMRRMYQSGGRDWIASRPVQVGGGPEHGGATMSVGGAQGSLEIVAQLPGAPPIGVAWLLYVDWDGPPRFDLLQVRLPRSMNGTPAARAWSVRWKALRQAVAWAAELLDIELRIHTPA